VGQSHSSKGALLNRGSEIRILAGRGSYERLRVQIKVWLILCAIGLSRRCGQEGKKKRGADLLGVSSKAGLLSMYDKDIAFDHAKNLSKLERSLPEARSSATIDNEDTKTSLGIGASEGRERGRNIRSEKKIDHSRYIPSQGNGQGTERTIFK